jgi:hypothetical protein
MDKHMLAAAPMRIHSPWVCSCREERPPGTSLSALRAAKGPRLRDFGMLGWAAATMSGIFNREFLPTNPAVGHHRMSSHGKPSPMTDLSRPCSTDPSTETVKGSHRLCDNQAAP